MIGQDRFFFVKCIDHMETSLYIRTPEEIWFQVMTYKKKKGKVGLLGLMRAFPKRKVGQR